MNAHYVPCTPQNALEFGKAAEHLVCADLIMSGYKAFLSDQGLPYDVLLDLEGKILKVQVKSAFRARNVNAAGRNSRIAYGWSVLRKGKDSLGAPLSSSDCDIVALVALDIWQIAYIPFELCGRTIQLSPPGSVIKTNFRSGYQWARNVDEFPLSEAIKGDISIYRSAKRQLTHCVHGHAYVEENTKLNKNGSKICLTCRRLRYKNI